MENNINTNTLEHPFSLENGLLVQKSPAEWSQVIHYLKQYATEHSAQVYIPVTEDSFKNYKWWYETSPLIYKTNLYKHELNHFVTTGYIFAKARVESNIVRVSYCMNEGDKAGKNSQRDITAILDWNGKFVVLFDLLGISNRELEIIELLLKKGLPVLDEQGNINARFEQIERYSWGNYRPYYKVFIDGLCGMMDCYLEVPCIYKNVELLRLGEKKIAFCVQSIENKYGLILPDSKEENIPAEWFSPFKHWGDDMVTTTQHDGSEVHFEINKDRAGKWIVYKLNNNGFEWESEFERLKDGNSHKIRIPVTAETFRCFNDFGHWFPDAYVKQGYAWVDAQIESNIVTISCCVERECDADEDGYGMSSGHWARGILDWQGNFVTPFTLNNDGKELATIELLLKKELPVLDEQGNINAQFEQILDHNEHYYKVFVDGLCGLISHGRLAVDCKYKNVELLSMKADFRFLKRHNIISDFSEYWYCVETTDNKFGIVLPYSKEENIPAIYCSPFKKVAEGVTEQDGIIASTREDGSEIHFEVKYAHSSYPTINEIKSEL